MSESSSLLDVARGAALVQVSGRRRWHSIRLPRLSFWLDPRNVLAVWVLRAYDKEVERRVERLLAEFRETEVSVPVETTTPYGG